MGQDLNMQIYIITATIILQIFASLYLCKLTSSARPLNASRAMAAAKMCNSVSFILMCAICYFLWNTVYSCYDSPMYAIILMLVDFIWVGRAIRYKKHARYLRYRNNLAQRPLLAGPNVVGPRDLNAPSLPDPAAVMTTAVYAQPALYDSNDSEAPLCVDVKEAAIWEANPEENV